MAKTDRCVVRNEAYTRGSVANMERHNERKNEHYGNGDVDLSRSGLNVHFKQYESAYLQAFDKLVADGTISIRGQKTDGTAKIVDEMIFDVNTEYFERNGGYEYAKSFFEEAYRNSIKEAGGEEYILSAVMHADERNKALSEQFGRDVYHYHLHVVYIPVVNKEVFWTKRCKEPALVGTVKEVIKQVSNSKKWASEQVEGEDGTKKLVYSYSPLQDRFYEHMKSAGFHDFERGERGSTAEHLDVLDYKIKQDEKAVTELEQAISEKTIKSENLNKSVQKRTEKLSDLNEKLKIKKQDDLAFAEIDKMPKTTITGNIQLAPADWKKVSSLAKEGISTKDKISTLVSRNNKLEGEVKTAWQKYKDLKEAYDRLYIKVSPYLEALKAFPEKVNEFFTTLFHREPKTKSKEIDTIR